jgi:hypothetical protein
MRGQTNLIVGLIGLVIFVLIALNLTPTVATQTATAAANTNLTAAGISLVNLAPLLFVVIIITAILGYVTIGRGG